MRYFIKLSYCGTAYNGWQIQKNTPNTIQQILNEKFSLVLNEEIGMVGCGRTDAGVHAREFYAHFDSSKDNLKEKSDYWIHKFNSVIPKDIAIQEILKVKPAANARFDAKQRTYQYFIHFEKDPFLIERSYYLYHELDLKAMKVASAELLLNADFSCFSKSRTQVKTNVCKVTKADWKMEGHSLVFTISADRFLRNMVRAVVGTLIEIGKGKISQGDFRKIILAKKRSLAGVSVPACGLYLTEVLYPDTIFEYETAQN